MPSIYDDKTGSFKGRADRVSLRGLIATNEANNGWVEIATRDSILNDYLGIRGENFSWGVIDTATALTSQTTRYAYLPLREGEVVSKLYFMVSVVSNTVTTLKAGLYDTAGNRLAASANSATALDATGLATFTMATPYTVPTTGIYLGAILSHASTAGTLGAMAAVTGKVTSTLLLAGTEASQTDLDATATITAATSVIWVGFS